MGVFVGFMSEDLVLFRGDDGRLVDRPILLTPARRLGAAVYHGWLFDRQGRCIEQPCEPRPRFCENCPTTPPTRARSAPALSSPTWDRANRRSYPTTNR